MHRKELGAFYTPPAYCKKALELVRKAIKQIPKGNDYILVDRCAGTGNLEEPLTDKNVEDISLGELPKYLSDEFIKNYIKEKSLFIPTILEETNLKDTTQITLGDLERFPTKTKIKDYLFDNELSHCIVTTYELKEWLVLNERIGDKVKTIIPPKGINQMNPLVDGGDALAVEVFEDIKPYIEDKKCNVILFENPPYSDIGAVQNNPATSKNKTSWKSSLVCEKMREYVKDKSEISNRAINDLANLFIWSGFEYYLTLPEDSYIVFSPPKYFKSQHLIEKKFEEGFIFNRYYFHAKSPSAISCVWWKNISDKKEKYSLEIFDIDNPNPWLKNAELKSLGQIEINKVYRNLSYFYERYNVNQYPNDTKGITLAWNGEEIINKKYKLNPIYNDNLIGYLIAQDFGFEHPRLSTNLVRCLVYAEHGFYLREDNFLEKLPLFCAGKYESGKRWWESGTIFKSSDGGNKFEKDKNFLKSCFIYTCLSYFNKCLSFDGSDGRRYQNKLCFDEGSFGNKILKKYKLDKDEKELIHIFKEVLKEAKKTKKYNKDYLYGVYQISKELNTSHKKEDNIIYDYPELNTKLIELKFKLTRYYEKTIREKLFKYELLK